MPVPVRPTFCGLPPPLSETETAADRTPVALGVNFTLMKQLAPDGTLVPQVLVWLKSPAFTPTIVMLVMLTVASLLLLSVMVFGRLVVLTGWVPKFSPVGVSFTAVATPVRVSFWVLLEALSVKVTEPVNVPIALGLKVTLIEQLAPGAMVAPQVFVWANGPVATMLVISKIPSPVFLSVAV